MEVYNNVKHGTIKPLPRKKDDKIIMHQNKTDKNLSKNNIDI